MTCATLLNIYGAIAQGHGRHNKGAGTRHSCRRYVPIETHDTCGTEGAALCGGVGLHYDLFGFCD